MKRRCDCLELLLPSQPPPSDDLSVHWHDLISTQRKVCLPVSLSPLHPTLPVIWSLCPHNKQQCQSSEVWGTMAVWIVLLCLWVLVCLTGPPLAC